MINGFVKSSGALMQNKTKLDCYHTVYLNLYQFSADPDSVYLRQHQHCCLVALNDKDMAAVAMVVKMCANLYYDQIISGCM